MASLQELQRIDRELFSELTESPINPAFLHMSTPYALTAEHSSFTKLLLSQLKKIQVFIGG